MNLFNGLKAKLSQVLGHSQSEVQFEVLSLKEELSLLIDKFPRVSLQMPMLF